MKYLNKIKKYLPNDPHSMRLQVCIFHLLVGKDPTRATARLTKAYIERQIGYEEVKKLMKLR